MGVLRYQARAPCSRHVRLMKNIGESPSLISAMLAFIDPESGSLFGAWNAVETAQP